MKRTIPYILVIFSLFGLTSCFSYETMFPLQNEYYGENIVVRDNICYVYYTNPTQSFLNTLRIIDGSYHYYYHGKYLPVEFPRWNMWKPNRFYYYKDNRLMWRERMRINYRQNNNIPMRRDNVPNKPKMDNNKGNAPQPQNKFNNRPKNFGTQNNNVRNNTRNGRK